MLQSVAGYLDAPNTAPKRSHPTTCLVAEQERNGPVAVQEAMVTRADHAMRLPYTHMMLITRPEQPVETLDRITTSERSHP